MISVKTDKIGNILGAKKGNEYAMKVTKISRMFKLNIPLLNQERFFIFFSLKLNFNLRFFKGNYFPALNKKSFSSLVKLSYPDVLILSKISSICSCAFVFTTILAILCSTGLL